MLHLSTAIKNKKEGGIIVLFKLCPNYSSWVFALVPGFMLLAPVIKTPWYTNLKHIYIEIRTVFNVAIFFK